MNPNSSQLTTDGEAAQKRTIILLDVDCFEVQVWLNKLRPDLIGKDEPVVILNNHNRILSRNYTALSLGVERGDGWKALEAARAKCNEKGKELIEIKASERFGKVDNFFPQTESDQILKVLEEFQSSLQSQSSLIIIERSGRDEFYIDVTDLVQSWDHYKWENNGDGYHLTTVSKLERHSLLSFPTLLRPVNLVKVVESWKVHPNSSYHGKPVTIMETDEGSSISATRLARRIISLPVAHVEESRLINGAIIAQHLMELIKNKTTHKYQMSAGIAESKLVAKLGCSRNRPQGITIVLEESYMRLSKKIAFKDLPGFGSNTSSKIKEYYDKKYRKDIKTVCDLLRASNGGADFESVLKEINTHDAAVRAKTLYDLCHFLDTSPVIPVDRQKPFSTFMSFEGMSRKGKEFLDKYWFKVCELAEDMTERILYSNEEGRRVQKLVAKFKMMKDYKALSDEGNTLDLKDKNATHEVICEHVRKYYRKHNICPFKVLKITLIAKDIVEEEQ